MEYKLAEAEAHFADLIWAHEPLTSGQLVKLANEALGWKSTTSYTVLRRLCDRGIFQNQRSIVTSRISREEFNSGKSRQFIAEAFDGSLPKFLAAFMGRKKLSEREIREIRQMIDSYEETADTGEHCDPSCGNTGGK